MDGASKFVKGDAIAGLIITLINIGAGFVIGMTMMGMTATDSLTTFSILTIGDGLVSQIPSLMIAIGAGMLVTKSRSKENIGQELPKQFLQKSRALLIGGGMIMALAIVPGMPTVPFGVIGIALLVMYRLTRNHEQETVAAEKAEKEKENEEQPEEQVEDLIDLIVSVSKSATV